MKQRNYGIDLLRLVSMFFIVSTHVVSHGGSLTNTTGFNNIVSWIVLMVGITCLNCYALISGYVGYRDTEKPFRYSKFISVWLPVFFYSVVIYVVGGCMGLEEFDGDTILTALTPVSHISYWYFTAYVPLFFATPYLNRMFHNLTDRQMNKLALTILVIFSLLTSLSISFGDTFNLNTGMSFLWLLVLYIIGAWIKKCRIGQKIKTWKLWIGFLLCILAGMAIYLYTPFAGLALQYFNVTYVIGAIILVCIFSRINPAGVLQKTIALFAPATFGVYLIHCHPVTGRKIVYMAFTGLASQPPLSLWAQALGWICVIFFGSLLIDRVRIWLFKVCGIDSLVSRLEQKLSAIGQKQKN